MRSPDKGAYLKRPAGGKRGYFEGETGGVSSASKNNETSLRLVGTLILKNSPGVGKPGSLILPI
jgi:hypothetical protein